MDRVRPFCTNTHNGAPGGLAEPDFRELFDALPGLYLVLRPDDPTYTIVAANKAYAQATMTNPAEIVGRPLFDVFPDNPDDPNASGVANLRASLRQVLATKKSHTMPAQKYDIRRPDDEGGGFEERYWSPVNTPFAGADGEVRFILHRVEDITELVRLKRLEAERGKIADDLRVRADRMEAELFLRGRELAESQRLIREREEVEAKLRATQARFSLAFAQAPIGMVLLTPEGKIVEVNQAFVDMLGYSQEDLISNDSSFYTHPDDVVVTRNFFASLRQGLYSKGSIEKRYFRRDGEILWARASGTMRRDEQGNPSLVIAIVEDITARKRAEERYRFLAESIPQMVWTATPDGMLDYVNGQGTAYFGVAQGELLGGGWLAWVHPEDRNPTIERWKRSVQSGEPYETAFRLKRGGDGSWRWHLVRALPLAGDNGGIVQWFGTCTDIEDQKQADANLHQQWRTFDTALSHTPDFIYTFDLAGRFTYVNRSLLALWRISLDQAVGKNFFDLGYPPDLAARLQLQIQRVIDTKQPLRDQTPFTGPSGETRHYEYIFVAVLDADGRVKAVAGSTRDITEQNRAAQQIEEDRRRWRELLLQVPAGIAVLRGPEHRFEWVNTEYIRLVGRPAEALIGNTVLEAFPEVLGQVYLDLLNGVYRSGEPFIGHELPIRLNRADGTVQNLYLNFVYSPTRDVNGAIDGVFAHITDVTDLVATRKRIEASEERFRLAFQAVEGIVYDWDPRTGTVERSGNLERLLGIGVADAEPTARWWQERVHPEDAARSSLGKIPSLGRNQDHFETEFRVRHADGRWVYALDRGYIVRDENGDPVRVVGSTHDVTEERILLDALRQSEARFRQAIDSMPQLVWSTLPDGEPDLYNKQWLDYTGLSSAISKGDEWNPVHPDDRSLVRERWRHSLHTGDLFEVEFRFRRFDGQYRWFLARATPIRDDSERIVRWFATSTDIEDRKKAELAVLTKQKLESLGLLAGGIAHDFNNLLVGVLGGASYAAEALPASHPLQSVLGDIVTAGERAAHLTRQMLAYAGKGRFLIERVDIGELVRSTCNLIRGSIPKHVLLTLDIGRNLPPVEADSGQMQQIVMNLILNAVEAIDSSRIGTVTVSTTLTHVDGEAIPRKQIVSGGLVPGAYLLFEVQDNGSGMDLETQTKIFDPFFTTKFTGRGLGLSAVQGILRTHNGALELSSTVGEGSTFRVFLPAFGQPALSGPVPGSRARHEVGTVLVVDDEQIVRRTAKASLERAGFGVVLAESGEQALHELRNDLQDGDSPAVDLIVLDMSMPVMNGKDVMEKIRRLGMEVPVLICSGYSEAEVYREFSGLDIAGFIQKPFTSRDLTAKISDVISAGSRRRARETG